MTKKNVEILQLSITGITYIFIKYSNLYNLYWKLALNEEKKK